MYPSSITIPPSPDRPALGMPYMPGYVQVVEGYRYTLHYRSSAPPTAQDISSDSPPNDVEMAPPPAPRRSKSLTEKEMFGNQGSNYTFKRGSRSSMLPNLNTSPNTPTHFHESPHTPVRPRVLFYHRRDPHYGFTNFSPHPVLYKGKMYPTSEHLFQSFKFHGHRPNLAEHIRTCSQWPSVAFQEARRFQPEVRHDWKQVNIEMMERTLRHKFNQHQDLKDELLNTGYAELVEDSDKDSFWGIGADRRGRNELGKALERLRDKLRE